MVLNKTNKRNTIKFNLICKIRIKRKTLKKNIFFFKFSNNWFVCFCFNISKINLTKQINEPLNEFIQVEEIH